MAGENQNYGSKKWLIGLLITVIGMLVTVLIFGAGSYSGRQDIAEEFRAIQSEVVAIKSNDAVQDEKFFNVAEDIREIKETLRIMNGKLDR